MIEYHTIDGAPGQYFDCENGLGRISTTFCAENHTKSKTKEFITEHRRKDCRFCPVGALHSGGDLQLSESKLYKSMVCARCERVSSRLVFGRVCVSCYNRFHENKTGLNARGNPLKVVRHYYNMPVMVVSQGIVKTKVVDGVVSLSEAVITILLSDDKPSVFGRSISADSSHYAT